MDKLQIIKDTLHLTNKEINAIDIDYLFPLVEKLRDIERLDKLIRRNLLPDNKSLLELLINKVEVKDEYITTLRIIADKEAAKRLETKGKGKYLRSLEDIY